MVSIMVSVIFLANFMMCASRIGLASIFLAIHFQQSTALPAPASLVLELDAHFPTATRSSSSSSSRSLIQRIDNNINNDNNDDLTLPIQLAATMTTNLAKLHAVLDIIAEGDEDTKNRYIEWTKALGIAKISSLETLWNEPDIDINEQVTFLQKRMPEALEKASTAPSFSEISDVLRAIKWHRLEPQTSRTAGVDRWISIDMDQVDKDLRAGRSASTKNPNNPPSLTNGPNPNGTTDTGRVLPSHIRTTFDTLSLCTELTEMRKGREWYTNLVTQASRGTPVLKAMLQGPTTYNPSGAQETREYGHWQGELIAVFKTKIKASLGKSLLKKYTSPDHPTFQAYFGDAMAFLGELLAAFDDLATKSVNDADKLGKLITLRYNAGVKKAVDFLDTFNDMVIDVESARRQELDDKITYLHSSILHDPAFNNLIGQLSDEFDKDGKVPTYDDWFGRLRTRAEFWDSSAQRNQEAATDTTSQKKHGVVVKAASTPTSTSGDSTPGAIDSTTTLADTSTIHEIDGVCHRLAPCTRGGRILDQYDLSCAAYAKLLKNKKTKHSILADNNRIRAAAKRLKGYPNGNVSSFLRQIANDYEKSAQEKRSSTTTTTTVKQALTSTVSSSLSSLPDGAEIHLADGTVYVADATDAATNSSSTGSDTSDTRDVTAKAAVIQHRAALVAKQRGYVESDSNSTTLCNMMSSSRGTEPQQHTRASYASAAAGATDTKTTAVEPKKRVIRVKVQNTNVQYDIRHYARKVDDVDAPDMDMVDRGANSGLKGKTGLIVKVHGNIHADVSGINADTPLKHLKMVDFVKRYRVGPNPDDKVLGYCFFYADYNEGNTIHTAGQFELYDNMVDDRSRRKGGTGTITLNQDQGRLLLSTHDGLPYMYPDSASDVKLEDDLENERYPLVYFTLVIASGFVCR